MVLIISNDTPVKSHRAFSNPKLCRRSLKVGRHGYEEYLQTISIILLINKTMSSAN